MSINYIDAPMIQKAFLSAATALDAKKEWINELNVFPVPDGDTGTNMTLTIMAAANDASCLENPDMETICKVISSGTLRGARGNSGVITSQLRTRRYLTMYKPRIRQVHTLGSESSAQESVPLSF